MKLFLALTLLPTIAGFGDMNPVKEDVKPDDDKDVCGDDDAGIDEDSGGSFSCAIGFEMLGNQCDDDAVIVALGAPAGWFAEKCPATCGIGCFDGDKDDTPPCLFACLVAVGVEEDVEPTCEVIKAVMECASASCEEAVWVAMAGEVEGHAARICDEEYHGDYDGDELDDACSEGHDGREGATSEARCTAMVGCMYDANSDHCFSATEGGVTTEAVGEGYD